MSEERRLCRVYSLGLVSYREGLAWQRRLHEEVAAGGEDRLLLLEHPPVITLGRGADPANVLASRAILAEEGIEIHEVERGGDVTYHGPGQLVGYPILSLARHGRDLHALLRRYEEVGIRVLARFGLTGRRDPRYTGVWVGEEKIMAIGVAVKKWVTYHGFAFNVALNLAHFGLIHPCGIRDKGVTSLAALLGRPVARAEVEPPVVEEIARVFGLEMVWEAVE
ncbi:MAG: lipoyl(octanoyl) transferase LipB [Firmicutes bacterium]|nr:lipoyl(octanoyl) transferase LipB [Bacillota bacterium]